MPLNTAPPTVNTPPASIAVDTADTVTILVAKYGKILTKRWTRFEGRALQETPYDDAKWFCAVEHPVSNIRELGAAIEEIAVDQRAAIVRGSLAPGVNPRHMVRRSASQPVTLVATPRRWVGLDIDGICCPAGIDPVFEPDAVVEHVITLLPPPFYHATVTGTFPAATGLNRTSGCGCGSGWIGQCRMKTCTVGWASR